VGLKISSPTHKFYWHPTRIHHSQSLFFRELRRLLNFQHFFWPQTWIFSQLWRLNFWWQKWIISLPPWIPPVEAATFQFLLLGVNGSTWVGELSEPSHGADGNSGRDGCEGGLKIGGWAKGRFHWEICGKSRTYRSTLGDFFWKSRPPWYYCINDKVSRNN